ncbi:flavodoxin family protein [Methanosarcina barkeri]|uniref:flavodoxin family protein n=1 Tax=Methanosarcina barkeri TaxID=2208 RepID=UPI000B0C169A|nr:flavodoxin domain-containing protein [Methanosarcina barkeri]
MKMESAKLVYFSPTGTTKAVVKGIAHGINQGTVELIDITRPDARKQPLQISEDELLVVGVPVYMGRVPALLNEWLNTIQAHNTPTVCVVVYGNRAYEDALLELKKYCNEMWVHSHCLCSIYRRTLILKFRDTNSRGTSR